MLDPNEMITLYNLNQAKQLRIYSQAMIDRSANENRSLYTGVEASFSMRVPGRRHDVRQLDGREEHLGLLRIGRQPERADRPATCIRAATWRRADVSAISATSTCRSRRSSSWRAITACQLGVDFGAVLQSFGGLERVVTWQPAANLFPDGQRTQAQTLILTEPGSLFGERWDQLDVNFKKNIRYGNKVHTFQLDIFNVFNNNSIRTMNDAVGTSLGQVTAIMPGRFPRIGYQFKW